MSVTRLFVYGTLRRGFANHRELGGAELLGSLLAEARYALVVREGYPALVRGNDAVSGELYAVDAALLARLDVFEGKEYVRGPVSLADGSVADAYWSADESE